MKLIGLSFALLAATLGAQTANAEIEFRGQSALFYYNMIQGRTEGTSSDQGKSFLGSPVTYQHLYDFLTCSKKEGWVFTSYRCVISGTDQHDILGTQYINMRQDDELGDMMERVNREANRRTFLQISGASAARIYTVVNTLRSDSGFSETTGQTTWLKRNYSEVSLRDLMSCRRIDGLLGTKYRCVVANVTVADANAPVVIETDANKK